MKFAFIIFGCGIFGGTENHELTLAMLSAAEIGATFEHFAPDDDCDLIDPFTKDPFNAKVIGKGRMLDESAKLVRGEIKSLKDLKVENYDALIVPGGYGAVNTLSNLGKFVVNKDSKEKLSMNKEFVRVVKGFHEAKKPILAICLAPLPTAVAIDNECKITLATNTPQIPGIKKINYDTKCQSDSFVYDEKNLLYSTPAVTFGPDIKMMHNGIRKAFVHLSDALKLKK